MLLIILSLAVALIGAVVYLIAAGKAAQLGLVAFGVGLLVLLWHVDGAVSITARPAPAQLR